MVATLSGYDAAIDETAGLTDERTELDEHTIDALNIKFGMLTDVISGHPKVAVTCFQADDKKSGGTYRTVAGTVQRLTIMKASLC